MEGVTTMSYPVSFSVTRPERYSRAQLGLRVVLFLLIGVLGFSLGALFLALYLALPAFAAIALSGDRSGLGDLGDLGGRSVERDASPIARLLRWIMAMYAYFALLTDRFPISEPERDVHLEIRQGGVPTVSSALLRIIYGIPSLVVLALLLCVAAVAWLVAFVLVLAGQHYGRGLFAFQSGVLRWMARLLAYEASLVDEYPPFSLAEAPRAATAPLASQP